MNLYSINKEDLEGGLVIAMADSAKDLASLYAKVAAVTGEVARIPKSRVHPQGWKFASWDDISSALNESLGKNKLAIIPSMIPSNSPPVEVGKNKNNAPIFRYVVRVRFILADGDTGAMLISEWEGDADDSTDKAKDKAATFCVKSFVKKTFYISTGDAEAEDRSYQDEEGYQPPPPARQQQPRGNKPAQPQPPAQQPPAEQPIHEVKKDAAPAQNGSGEVPTQQSFLKFAHDNLSYEKEDVVDILMHFSEAPKDKNGKLAWNSSAHAAMIEALIQWKAFHGVGKANEEAISPAGDWTFETARRWLGSQEIKEPYTADVIAKAIPVFDQYVEMIQRLIEFFPLTEAIGIIAAAKIGPWRPEKSQKMIEAVQAEYLKRNPPLAIVEKKSIEALTAGLGAEVSEIAPIESLIAIGDEAEPESEDLFGNLFNESQINL